MDNVKPLVLKQERGAVQGREPEAWARTLSHYVTLDKSLVSQDFIPLSLRPCQFVFFMEFPGML